MKINILVIDEEKVSFKEIKTILQEKLSKIEFYYDYVRNGSDGLEKINEKKYNLIILDMMLPKGNMAVKKEREDMCYGIDVLEKIKESKKNTNVICFTNVRNESVISEIQEYNAEYICKLGKGSNDKLVYTINKMINQ